MGFVLSKFRKSKPSTKDALDKIETDLRKLSRYQIDTELQQKRIIGRLVISGSFLYLAVLVLVYFFGPRDLTWQETVGWILPLILFPFILILIKRALSWYFDRKIVKNKSKYESLKKEKQQLLDDVMENETFKVAKEILEKYAPNHLLPKYLADQQRASPMSLTPIPRTGQGLRRRTTSSFSSSTTPTPIPYPGMGNMTPRPIRPYGLTNSGQYMRQPTNSFNRPAIMPGPSTPGGPGMMPRGPPPPRFMLPPPPTNPQYRTRKTGWLDKMVDYVVGDGPANRFALICRYCATHNGLATPDDFPYIGYRCVYCRQFNPPRQQRPSAATLPKNTVLIEEMDLSIKSPDSSINDEERQAESKEDSGSSTEKEKSIEKSEETNEKEDENDDDDEAIVELAASSVEDLRNSLDSIPLIDADHSGNEDSEGVDNADDNSQNNDQTSTPVPPEETSAQVLSKESDENDSNDKGKKSE